MNIWLVLIISLAAVALAIWALVRTPKLAIADVDDLSVTLSRLEGRTRSGEAAATNVANVNATLGAISSWSSAGAGKFPLTATTTPPFVSATPAV